MKSQAARTRVAVVALAACALLVACDSSPSSAPDTPPNVVLVILDTLRADHLGAYGHPDEISPALDALARGGVRFASVLSQSSWTRPSIGSMLTSRYPRTLGLYRERNEILNDSFETLAEMLEARGYTTIGLTANPNINSITNFHQGFDEYVDSDTVFRWMKATGAAGDSDADSGAIASSASLFEQALDLATQAGDGPIYLQLNLMDIHIWSKTSALPKILRAEYRDLFADRSNPSYSRLTRQLTDDLGGFVEALVRIHGWENTLFAIVSDHGEGLGDHPAVERSSHHGVLVYESQLQVPWILYQRDWRPANRDIAREVRLLDVVPTLLDLLGFESPPGLDGRSLRSLIDGSAEPADLPELNVAETQFRNNDRVAVYSDEWAYIENRTPLAGVPPIELQRRGQKENGSATDQAAAHPEVVERLSAHLAQWERRRPKARPTPAARSLGDAERDQLKAIGYLEE